LKKAIETLKKQPQSVDKKTIFWTAYKTLADEFDKELQRKYGDDLDASLIFVRTRIFPHLYGSLNHMTGWSFLRRQLSLYHSDSARASIGSNTGTTDASSAEHDRGCGSGLSDVPTDRPSYDHCHRAGNFVCQSPIDTPGSTIGGPRETVAPTLRFSWEKRNYRRTRT
jgi:hypothetical protein